MGTQRRTKTETSEFEGRSTINAQRRALRRPKSASRLGAHADHLRTMLATWRKCSAWLASRQRQTLPLSMRQIIHKFLRFSFNGVIEVLAHVLCLAGELDEVRHLPPNCYNKSGGVPRSVRRSCGARKSERCEPCQSRARGRGACAATPQVFNSTAATFASEG